MKFINLLVVSLLFASNGFADQSLPNEFLVYAHEGIFYTNSDFQGPIGSSGKIELKNMLVVDDRNINKYSVVSGDSVSLNSSRVIGRIAAKSLHARGSSYGKYQDDGNSQGQLHHFYKHAKHYSRVLSLSSARAIVPSNGKLVFTALHGYNIFSVSESDWNNSWGIEFVNNSHTRNPKWVINVSGRHIEISRKSFLLPSEFTTNSIDINFHEATTLQINNSGWERDLDLEIENRLGVPANILAPYADTEFFEGLITGQLIVGRLTSRKGCNGGQVNKPSRRQSCQCE